MPFLRVPGVRRPPGPAVPAAHAVLLLLVAVSGVLGLTGVHRPGPGTGRVWLGRRPRPAPSAPPS